VFNNEYCSNSRVPSILDMSRKGAREMGQDLVDMNEDSYYIVKIDAPPGVEVPGGCYVTVQSGPHVGLMSAYERLRDPKPKAHTLPDIVFLPSKSNVMILGDIVPTKPYLLVRGEDLDKARVQRTGAGVTRRPAAAVGAAIDRQEHDLMTPAGKMGAPVRRMLDTDSKEKNVDEQAAKRQRAGKLSPKALFASDSADAPSKFDEKNSPMDKMSALRAACTARLMWMLSNQYNYGLALQKAAEGNAEQQTVVEDKKDEKFGDKSNIVEENIEAVQIPEDSPATKVEEPQDKVLQNDCIDIDSQ
jgi:hypothetical protein